MREEPIQNNFIIFQKFGNLVLQIMKVMLKWHRVKISISCLRSGCWSGANDESDEIFQPVTDT